MSKQMRMLTVSGRTLGELTMPNFCPRCFWVNLRCDGKLPFQIPMPGIFNSIDAYVKRLVHGFFDTCGTLPPWFPGVGDVKRYVSASVLNWHNFEFWDEATNITLRGVPDDIFQMADASFHVFDYKTARLTERQDELLPIYEAQLNAYGFIAQRKGLSPVARLSLVYLEPKTEVAPQEVGAFMSNKHFAMHFKATLKEVKLREPNWICQLLQQARAIADEAVEPQGAPDCQNCVLLDRFLTVFDPPL